MGGTGSYAAVLQSASTDASGNVTLHFDRTDEIQPNKPYFLFATENQYSPTFDNVFVVAEQSQSVAAPDSPDWQMVSNFTPSRSLYGEYFL